jgi:hypothetical protein
MVCLCTCVKVQRSDCFLTASPLKTQARHVIIDNTAMMNVMNEKPLFDFFKRLAFSLSKSPSHRLIYLKKIIELMSP